MTFFSLFPLAEETVCLHLLSPTDAKALAFNEGAEYQLPLKRKKNTVNNLITLSYKTTLDLFTIQSHVFLLNLHYRYVSFFSFFFVCLLVERVGIILRDSETQALNWGRMRETPRRRVQLREKLIGNSYSQHLHGIHNKIHAYMTSEVKK